MWCIGALFIGGDSRDKLSLILVIKIYVCSNSKLEGVEGCVAQTIVEEGAKSEVV